MNYNFFSQKECDRCHKSLERGRTMSMFNTDCLCLECKEKERDDPEYAAAVNADHQAVNKGNLRFMEIRGGDSK
jgi:hypothetical protein